MSVDSAQDATRTGGGVASAPAEPRFAELLGRFRAQLDQSVLRWLAAKRDEAGTAVGQADELAGVLPKFFARGGKRLRPALLYYAYRGCGGRSEGRVMPAAMAVELLHTYLLIHDDIMDHAEVRRGAPAAQVLFRDLHRGRGWAGDSDHFGDSVAILLGDLAQSYSTELIGAVEVDPRFALDFRRCYSTMCQEVILGQYLEMTAAYRAGLSESELLHVLQMKSGRYSIERPIELGALLAGSSGRRLSALTSYGSKMGEAFQLQDDLLGLFGDFETVGKPVGGDLAEGKYTLLIHHTLNAASDEERKVVRSYLGNTQIGAEEVERVRSIIRRSGARDRVVGMIETRSEEALEVLETIELESDGAEFLRGLVAALRGRQR